MSAGAGEVVYDALLPDDAVRCAELERILFPGDDPWPAAAFLSEIGSRHNVYVAARCEGELVGYAGIALLGHRGDRECEVHTIGVDPAMQGRGIGRTLLGLLLDVADAEDARVFLDVRTDNTPALTLYRAHGFEIAGLRRRYYRPSNADAFLMVRPVRGRTGTEETGTGEVGTGETGTGETAPEEGDA